MDTNKKFNLRESILDYIICPSGIIFALINQMEFQVLDIVAILISFIALIFVAFLLSIPSERKLGHYLLASYLSIFIVDSSAGFVDKYLAPSLPALTMLLKTLIFLEPPLLYLFIRASVYNDFSLSKKTLLHLIPYVSLNLLFIPGYYLQLWASNIDSTSITSFFGSKLFNITYVIIHLQLIFYFILIFLLLKKYRQLLIENYSNPDMNNYKWLMQFSLIIFIFSTLAMVKNIVRFFLPGKPFDISLIFVSFCVLFFFCWLLLKALRNPQLFKGIPTNTMLVQEIMDEDPQSIGGDFNKSIDTFSKIEIKKLLDFMEVHKPYLNPSLNLRQLAEMTQITDKNLSLLINHKMGQHFFDFINEYRIRDAAEVLKDPTQKRRTILEILYEVGFNSKSSFNTAFKDKIGLTPTEYRKKHSNSIS